MEFSELPSAVFRCNAFPWLFETLTVQPVQTPQRLRSLCRVSFEATSDSLHSSKTIDPQHHFLNQSVLSQPLTNGHPSVYSIRAGTILCTDRYGASEVAKQLDFKSDLEHRPSGFPYNFHWVTLQCDEPSVCIVQDKSEKASATSQVTLHPFCTQRVAHTEAEADYEPTLSQLHIGTLENDCTCINFERKTSLEFSEERLTDELTKSTSIYPTLDGCGEVRAAAADVVRLTLADYLDQLDDSKNQLKTVPKLAILKRLTGPAEFARRAQQEDVELLNHSFTKLKVDNSQSGMDALALQTNISSEDYLLKRRSFLITRLSERYTELLQLLQEELELTGRPPEGYNQYLHEYHAAREAAKRLKLKEGTDQQIGSTSTSRNGFHSDTMSDGICGSQVTNETSGQYSSHETCLSTGLLGNYVQETRFPISPVTVRKASLKLSPSAHSLLVTSRLSLHDGDGIDTNNQNTLLAQPQEEQKSRVRSLSIIKPALPSQKEFVTNSGVVRGSWTKRKQAASRAALVSRGSMLYSGVLSLSLTDLRGPRSASSSDYEVKRVDDSIDSEQDANIGRGRVSTSSIISETTSVDEKHQTQAIAWLDVEIAALRNILVANLRCAAESSRSRESRKAYKQAARVNELKIARLEKQRELLQTMHPSEPEVISVDSFTISSSADGVSRCETESSEQGADGQINFTATHKQKLDTNHKNPPGGTYFSRGSSSSPRVYHTEPRPRRSNSSLLSTFESTNCFPSTRSSTQTDSLTSVSSVNSVDAYRPTSNVSPKMSWDPTHTTRHASSSGATTPATWSMHSEPSTVIISKPRSSFSRRPQLLPRTPYEHPVNSITKDTTRTGSNSVLNVTRLYSKSTHPTDFNGTPSGACGKTVNSKYGYAVHSDKPPLGGYTMRLRSYSPAASSTLTPPPTPQSSPRSTKIGLESHETGSPSKWSDRQSIGFRLPAYRSDERGIERSPLKPSVTLTHAPVILTSTRLERHRYPNDSPLPTSESVRTANSKSTQTSIREDVPHTTQSNLIITSSAPDPKAGGVGTVNLSRPPDGRRVRTPAPVERPTLIHVVSPKTMRRFPTPDLPHSAFCMNLPSELCARSLASSNVKIMREVQPNMSSPSLY